jgi:hypothetical protein
MPVTMARSPLPSRTPPHQPMTINWQDVLITIGSSVGGGGIVLGGAAWLIKTALMSKLSQETEAFKARLKADADVEIERLKSSLQKIAVEHQVRFSKLHSERAEAIAELYKRLVIVFSEGHIFVLTGGFPSEGQRGKVRIGLPATEFGRERFRYCNRRSPRRALCPDRCRPRSGTARRRLRLAAGDTG